MLTLLTRDVLVVNQRHSLDAVPIVPFYVPLGQPLKEHMYWSAMLLYSLAVGGELCCMTEPLLGHVGEG